MAKTDPFAVAAAAAKAKLEQSKCDLCGAVAALPKEQRDQYYAALTGATLVGGKEVSAPTIVIVLAGLGVSTSDTAIRQHRRDLRNGVPCKGLARVIA